MKKIIWDLDGTLRDLLPGREGEWDYDDPVEGKSFCAWIDDNMELLVSSPATPYIEVAHELPYVYIMTMQADHWVPYTFEWIREKFPGINLAIHYVDKVEDKLNFLDENTLLIDDYPKYSDYSRIALIDRPYNRKVKDPLERITTPDQLRQLIRRFRDE